MGAKVLRSREEANIAGDSKSFKMRSMKNKERTFEALEFIVVTMAFPPSEVWA